MIYTTYADIKQKVQDDLDLQGELFITDRELLGYCNAGIDECESEIHTIYEDYFLSEAVIDLVAEQSLYDLPANIYAMKIREMVYDDDNGTTYEVKRLHGFDRLEIQKLADRYSSTSWHRYYIINNAASTITSLPQIKLVPKSRVTVSSGLVVHYLRNANRMVDDNSVCDIPEFAQFVIQYIKSRCYEKEGHPNIELARVDLEKYRGLMRDTLSNMIIDGDNQVKADFSFYSESS